MLALLNYINYKTPLSLHADYIQINLPDHDPHKRRLQLPLPIKEERRLCTQTEKTNTKLIRIIYKEIITVMTEHIYLVSLIHLQFSTSKHFHVENQYNQGMPKRKL